MAVNVLTIEMLQKQKTLEFWKIYFFAFQMILIAFDFFKIVLINLIFFLNTSKAIS